MKNIFLLFVFLYINFFFGQFKKIELTNEEVQFIAENTAGGIFNELDEKKTSKIIELNKTLYFFEVSQQGNVIYRESFRRWNPFGSLYDQSKRVSLPLCFKYTDLSSELILQLLETSVWKSKKAGNKKFICNADFDIFKKDINKNIYNLNEIKGLEVRAYKLVEQ